MWLRMNQREVISIPLPAREGIGRVLKPVGAQGSAAVNLGEVVSKALGECVSFLFDVDRYHDNVARHGCVCVCWI